MRVKLKNFVTYDHVEFQPGPYLNMIIGPNGTGKSTISCAIALCLGYRPSLLGRATEVTSFVKIGHENGYAEIELKGMPGERNPVVRRHLSRGKLSAAKTFYLNNKPVPAKEIAALMDHFHVQIDNLCSFLPQDKVTEFARMTPAKLLIETEKASTEGEALAVRHDRLIEHSKTLRAHLADLRREKDELAAVSAQTARLQGDADRHQRRKALEERIQVLEVSRKFARMAEAQRKLKGTEKRRARMHAKVQQWDQRVLPFSLAMEAAQEKLEKASHHVSIAETERGKSQAQLRKLQGDYDKIDMSRDQMERELESLSESERRRLDRVARLKETISELEERTAEPPEEVDLTHISAERQRIDQQIAAQRRNETDLQADLASVQVANRQNQGQGERLQNQINKLKDQANVKLNHLRNSDENTYKATLWLRDHAQEFEGKIYPPVLTEIELKPEYRHLADSVEMPIRWATLKTFVCERRADYDKLSAILNDGMRLRVNIAEIEGVTTEELHGQMPLPHAELRQLGFDGYVVDYLQGPQTVINYICQSDNLHKIPLAERGDGLHRERAERLFNRFIVGDTLESVNRSKYIGRSGQQQILVMSRVASRARNLVHNIDTEALTRAERERAELLEQAKDLRRRWDDMQAKQNAIREVIAGLKSQREEVSRERQKAIEVKRVYEQAVMELQSKRTQLERETNAPSLEGKRREIQQRIRMLSNRLVKVTEDISDRLTILFQQMHTFTECRLARTQAEAALQQCSAIMQEIEADSEALRQQIYEVKQAYKAARAESKRIYQEARRVLDELPSNLRAEVKAVHDAGLPSVEDLTDQITEARVDLESAPSVSRDVLRRYQEKLEQQADLQMRVDEKEVARAKLEKKVGKYRAVWEPALEELIERVNDRFADAFDQFQCAGEVRLAKPVPPGGVGPEAERAAQDAALAFEDYTVEIRVKFRQEEELQLLTAERQSGGERSLSTILYLMSLTELSASPFSLVDEINQGMDQRAERLVHDHMVRTTCRQAAGQYFLITPKLLTGLRYDEKMRLLIINAGDYVPERFSFKDYVNTTPRAIAA